VDTLVGMAFSNLIGLAIIITTAATLHANGKTDIQSSAQAAEALKPLAGVFAEAIFALGIIGTGLILSVETTHTPRIEPDKRVHVEQAGSTFMRVSLRFGYMETPNIPKALGIARKFGLQFDIMTTSFFLSRRALRRASRSGMPRWQDRLFIALARSANDATDYFQIPTDRVVEVGTQVNI
jgi:hypothetical protein